MPLSVTLPTRSSSGRMPLQLLAKSVQIVALAPLSLLCEV
jgi:hypothetical protein